MSQANKAMNLLIIPLIGLYSFQFFSLFISIFPIAFISDLSSFAFLFVLKDSNGYESIAFNIIER